MLLLAGAGCYVWMTLVPAFKSPRSRVYAGRLGYPSLMRLLGKPIEVKVDSVRVRPMVKTISAEGFTGYLNEMPVKCEVAGIVTRILVEPGQDVRKGQVLLKVNTGWHFTRIEELKRLLAKWELEVAKTDLKRAHLLFNDTLGRALSAREFELAQLQVKRAETSLALAEEQYRNSLTSKSRAVVNQGTPAGDRDPLGPEVEVVALDAGTVFDRRVQLGQNLVGSSATNEVLFLVGDRLTFVAQMDQRYLSVIKVGDQGKFYLKAYPGPTFRGEVMRIAHTVQPENLRSPAPQTSPLGPQQAPDTFRVWIAISRKDLEQRKLATGMNGYCIFERPFSAPALPEGALMRYSGRTGKVLTVDGANRVQVKNVTYSGADDGWVAIEDGLQEGERVITEGQVGLKPGDQVTIDEE